MSRKYVVEVNPSIDYLGAVLRELRWRAQEESCKDPFLQRVFEKRSLASPYRYVRGHKTWTFRFDIQGRKHHKGAVYLFPRDGMLQKIDRDIYGKKNEWGDRDCTAIAAIEKPSLEDMTSDILLQLLQELEVLEIMQS